MVTKHGKVVSLLEGIPPINSHNALNMTVCYYHVSYEFQKESTLYSLPVSHFKVSRILKFQTRLCVGKKILRERINFLGVGNKIIQGNNNF